MTVTFRHDWRCDVCHRFIQVGAVRHWHCDDDIKSEARRRAELLERIDAMIGKYRDEEGLFAWATR